MGSASFENALPTDRSNDANGLDNSSIEIWDLRKLKAASQPTKEKAAKSRLFRESAPRGAPYTTLGLGGLYS